MPKQVLGSYKDQKFIGFEGDIITAIPNTVITGVNESEAMPQGRVVMFDSGGTVADSVKLANATGKIRGVTARSQYADNYGLDLLGVAQVVTYTVGGSIADGNYIITIDGTDVLVVRDTTPVTNDNMATALRAAINDDPLVSQLVTASGATAAVIVTKNDPGSFSFDSSVTGGGTLVPALTTGGEADGIAKNEAANIVTNGSILVRPETAVTPASGVFYRITANAGVGTALGAFTGVDDGGNTEELTSASWGNSSAGGAKGGLAILKLNLD